MKKSARRPYWLNGSANILTLAGSLTLAGAIGWSAVHADHAGDAAADAAQSSLLGLTDAMARSAAELLATVADGPGGIESAVGYDRAALLDLAFDDAARTNYVYWPYLRKGLPLEYMSAQQKQLTHELLNTALSARGYLTAVQIMQLESILAANEVVGFPRGTENYTLAIFGDPAGDGLWGWRFEGHHLSLNFTLGPGEVSVTPSFFGASPAEQRSGPLAGFRVQREVHDLGYDFMNALNESQRAQAVADGNPPFDIVSGTLNKPREQWEDWKDLPRTGLALSGLNGGQQALARRLVEEVVGAYRADISEAYQRQLDLNDLRFTWYGATEPGEPHYYRLDGPDFFFEYDLVQGNGNHVHAVWRSKQGDFGADLLMMHRREQAH